MDQTQTKFQDQTNPRRTVNFENIRLLSPVKENAIPKRRHDTNSVYSFGLKYSLKVEKKILKNISNSEYFNIDFQRLKQRLLTDRNFREAYAQRILMNKNTKKSYASIEKPFPLIKKVSSSQAINKTEDFIISIIKSPFHKKIKGSLERNIRLRKNRSVEVCERETQNNFFYSKLHELNKNITFTNREEEHKKYDLIFPNKKANLNSSNNKFLEDGEELDVSDIEGMGSNSGVFFFPTSKVNGAAQQPNKKEFFLIGSKFGAKNMLKKQAKNVKLSIEQIKIQKEKKELDKIERDIINSLERAKTRNKVEQGENSFNTTLNLNFEPKSVFGLKEKIFNESSISSIANNFKTKYNFNFNKHKKTNFINNSDRNLIEIKDDNLSKISKRNPNRFEQNENLDSKIIENENENLLSDKMENNNNLNDNEQEDKESKYDNNEMLNVKNTDEYMNLKSSNITKVTFENNSGTKKNSNATNYFIAAAAASDEKGAKDFKNSNSSNQMLNNINNSIVSEFHKSKNYSTEQNFDFKNIDKKINSSYNNNNNNFNSTNRNENFIAKYKSNFNYNPISSIAFSKNPLETHISNILSDCFEINNNNNLKNPCKYNSDLNAIRPRPKQIKPDFDKYKFDKRPKGRDCLLDNLKNYWDKREKSEKIRIKLETNMQNDFNKMSLYMTNENNNIL